MTREETIEILANKMANFERYKVEWEDVFGSLPPQDEFRYGRERAIEIIDKFMPESED